MAVHGKTGYVVFDSTTICATEWNVEFNQEELDVTTFCSDDDYKEWILGFKEANGSFTVLDCYDLLGSSGSITLGNDEVTYSGSILVNTHSATNSVDSRFEATWGFRFSGAISISCT